jgi:hypothetical protein
MWRPPGIHSSKKKNNPYCGVWFEIVTVTSFKKSLLFASLEQGSGEGSFIYMHVGIPSDLLKGTVRGSQTASDMHINEAPKVGCKLLERHRKYALPVSSKSNRNFRRFSKAAGAKAKQMLNFQGIQIHFCLQGRDVS